MTGRRPSLMDGSAEHANLVRLKNCTAITHNYVLARERGEGGSRARFCCSICNGCVSEMAAQHYQLGIRGGYKRGVRDGLEHAERRFLALEARFRELEERHRAEVTPSSPEPAA